MQTSLITYCPICKRALLGVVQQDYWGNQFCTHHSQEYARCYSCQRLAAPGITNGGYNYPDGRTICNLCRKTEITRPEQARAIADQVKGQLALQGIQLMGFSVPLHFVHQDELDRIHPLISAQQSTGITRYRVIQRSPTWCEKQVEDVFILYGLPAEHTASVFAHEFGHAWFLVNQFPNLDPVIDEGLCELVDYLWLCSQNTPEARFRIEMKMINPDPVYGTGFRAALQAYQLYGFHPMVQYIRWHKAYPSQ